MKEATVSWNIVYAEEFNCVKCVTLDGDRDRDPHWSTGLSSLGPNEEQKEGEREQGSKDHEGCVHPLRWWD